MWCWQGVCSERVCSQCVCSGSVCSERACSGSVCSGSVCSERVCSGSVCVQSVCVQGVCVQSVRVQGVCVQSVCACLRLTSASKSASFPLQEGVYRRPWRSDARSRAENVVSMGMMASCQSKQEWWWREKDQKHSACLSACLPACLSVCLPPCLSVCLPACMCS